MHFLLSSHHFLSDTAYSYIYCTLRAPSHSSLSPARSGPSPALSQCSSNSQLITLAHIFSLRSISSENFSLNLSSWILLKSQCNMASCPHHLLFQSSSCLYFLPREYTTFPSYLVLKLQKHLGFFIVPHFQLICSTGSCYFLSSCAFKLFFLLGTRILSPYLRSSLVTVLTSVFLKYYFLCYFSA